jgi:malonate transporter and related proteins
MLSALLATILPTFGIIFVGWFARKIGIWEKTSVAVLNNYAYYIALPALIFFAVVHADLGATFSLLDAKLLVGTLAAHLIIFLLALPFLRVRALASETRATLPMLITFGSTAYLGIPYATFAFGQDGTVYASLLSVTLVIALLFASIMMLGRTTKKRVSKSAVKSMLELPFLWAVLAGLAWPFLALPELPIFLDRFIEILSDSAGPTALLGMGTYLYDVRLKNIPWRATIIISFLKVTAPTLTTYALLVTLGVSGVRLAVGTAMAATATAVTSFILAEQYKLGERLTAGVILVSVLFSLVALSVISALAMGTDIFSL